MGAITVSFSEERSHPKTKGPDDRISPVSTPEGRSGDLSIQSITDRANRHTSEKLKIQFYFADPFILEQA